MVSSLFCVFTNGHLSIVFFVAYIAFFDSLSAIAAGADGVARAVAAAHERNAALAGSRERAQGEHPFMPCQPGSCALPHPLPAPDESGCHWPYGNVFFGGIKPYRNGDVICMLTEAQLRQDQEEMLRKSVEHGDFELVYQPQIDLHTLEVVGVEALLRSRNPSLMTMSTRSLLMLAEEIGLMSEIGVWVMRAACTEGTRPCSARATMVASATRTRLSLGVSPVNKNKK